MEDATGYLENLKSNTKAESLIKVKFSAFDLYLDKIYKIKMIIKRGGIKCKY